MMGYIEKRKHAGQSSSLQSTIHQRQLIPRDILDQCKPGSPCVLVSFLANNPNICSIIKRKLRKTDLVLERNGVITVFALIGAKEDKNIVSNKIEQVLAAHQLQTTLSVTYLDM